MPYRKNPFTTDEIYHVFNRSVARQPIFLSQRDYHRLTDLIKFYRFPKPPIRYSHYARLSEEQQENFINNHMKKDDPMVTILGYCIMPNHFHFLLKPKTNTAISNFMRNMQNSYSKYFNIKNNRSGSLFQSMFKAVHIETDEQLLHVSRYIHLNPVSSSIIHAKDLENYQWSSFVDYIKSEELHSFIDTGMIHEFLSPKNYRQFVFDQADYQKTLDQLKHLVLE